MSQTIIFREDTWNWCYYLFLFVLIFSILFFSILFIGVLKLILKLKIFTQITAQDGKSFAVTVSVWFNLVLYASLTLAAIYLLWIGGQDLFNGFTSVEVTPDSVRLIYIWPMPSKLISDDEIREIKLREMGRYGMRLELTTNNGKYLKSAGGHSEDIRKARADFIKALHRGGGS